MSCHATYTSCMDGDATYHAMASDNDALGLVYLWEKDMNFPERVGGQKGIVGQKEPKTLIGIEINFVNNVIATKFQNFSHV